jgi:hypothetical protein
MAIGNRYLLSPSVQHRIALQDGELQPALTPRQLRAFIENPITKATLTQSAQRAAHFENAVPYGGGSVSFPRISRRDDGTFDVQAKVWREVFVKEKWLDGQIHERKDFASAIVPMHLSKWGAELP